MLNSPQRTGHISLVRAEAWWIEQSRKSLYHFIWYTSGKKPPPHMMKWVESLLTNKRVNIIAPRGSAKAQPLDAKILTPTGWKRMGDIHVGDQVIAGDGTATTVTGVFPQGVKPSYKVTMSDGSSTESCDEHLWKVHLRTDKTDKWQVVNLNHLRTKVHEKTTRTYASGDKTKTTGVDITYRDAEEGYQPWLTARANRGADGYEREYRYEIPIVPPVQYAEQPKLPLDPYLLGVLLGDGSISGTSIRFTTADEEMVDLVDARLPAGVSARHVVAYDYGITTGGVGYKGMNTVLNKLKSLGLMGTNSFTKFIPEIFLRAAPSDRLEVLRGLLDTDGSFDKNKRGITYTTCSPHLRDGVVELVQSLGGVVRISEKRNTYTYMGEKRLGALSYLLSIKLPTSINPFRLSRKAAPYAETASVGGKTYPPARGIVDIEYVGDKEMQCIMVDHPDHTYVTDDYIVTHNTTYAVFTLAWLIGKSPFDTHFIGSVSAKQAEDRLEMVREIIDTNVRFRNVFPSIHVDFKRTNNKSEFTVWSDANGDDYASYRTKVGFYGDQKNPTVFACGIGSSALIGRRISGLCLIDDIHSEANSATPALRQKVTDWFNRTLMGCLKENARVLVICTRWGLDDHSGRLKELKNADGTLIWKTIDIPAIDKEGNSYWPDVFPITRLEQIRAEIGEIMFGLMFMNDPTTLSTGQWTIDMFYHGLPDPLPPDMEVLVSTDLAFTTKTASDYCVFALIGKAPNPNNPRLTDIYLLDMHREKYKFHDAIDALVAFCAKASVSHRVEAVLFENQAMTLGSYEEFLSRETGFSSKLVNAPGDKGKRLSEIALKAQRGGFFIDQKMEKLPILISEFIGYPRTDHDDTIDAIGLPIFYWNVSEVRAGILYLQMAIPETNTVGFF